MKKIQYSFIVFNLALSLIFTILAITLGIYTYAAGLDFFPFNYSIYLFAGCTIALFFGLPLWVAGMCFILNTVILFAIGFLIGFVFHTTLSLYRKRKNEE